MSKKKRKFWNIVKNETDNSADLTLYGSIGSDEYWDDISDKGFKKDIENLGDIENINLYVNSPGGSAFAAIAIANTLKAHKAKVTAFIDGLAASAATIITCACDIVKMPKNALFMIHNPWSVAIGEKKDFEKAAELMDKVKNSILETYLTKSNVDKDKLSELMDTETWMNAEEAKEYGFIDEILEDMEEPQNYNNMLIVNSLAFDISNFKNFPKKANKNIKTESKPEITIDSLKDSYPGLYQEIINQGMDLERKRIQEIEDLEITGYDEVLKNAKFEEPIDAANLALKILNLKKLNNKKTLENIINENQGIRVPTTPIKNEEDGVVAGVSVNNILKYMNGKTGGK